MAPEYLVCVAGLKLMWLVRGLDRVVLILLQNLKTVMNYFETFLMTALLKLIP
jgi:hypothetical protein